VTVELTPQAIEEALYALFVTRRTTALPELDLKEQLVDVSKISQIFREDEEPLEHGIRIFLLGHGFSGVKGFRLVIHLIEETES